MNGAIQAENAWIFYKAQTKICWRRIHFDQSFFKMDVFYLS